MKPGKLLLSVVVPVLLATVSACGSTVQQTPGSADTTVLGAATSAQVGGSAATGTATSVTSAPAGSVAVRSGGSTNPSGHRVGLPSTASGQSGGAPAAARGQAAGNTANAPAAATGATSGPGWDAHDVYVGVITQKDTQKVFATYGANNVDPGDTEAQAQAAANAVNASGGVAGHRLVLRFHDLATLATAQDPNGAGQQVCADFSQDHPVVAVWDLSTQVDQAPTLRACLAKARIPLFSAAARGIDDEELAELAPYYHHSLMVSWTRLAPVLIARLKAQGWFEPWNTALGQPGGTSQPVVGILVQDQSQGHRIATALQQAIAGAGRYKTVVYAYGDPSQGQAQSAEQFKLSGVTHVIVTDVELTAFQNAAASQSYKPRYGITTYNDPYSNLETSGFTPTGANNGALGVGWAPTFDVGAAHDPGPTPGWPRCAKIMTAAHQTFAGRLAQAYAATLCDTMFLIQGAAASSGGVSGPQLANGLAKAGSSFPIAIGFGAALNPGEPYSPGVVRDLGWDSSCSCMKYGGTTTRL